MSPSRSDIQKVVQCIKKGRPPGVCCRSLGISNQKYNKWMREGSQPECNNPLVVEFAEEVGAASADAEMELIDDIKGHARQDWRAADRILKLVNPSEYNDEIRISSRTESTIIHKVEINADMLNDLFGSLKEFVGEQGVLNGVPLQLESGDIDLDDLIDVIDAELVEAS